MKTNKVITYRSDDIDPTLISILWADIRDQEHIWNKLISILQVLANDQDSFGFILFGELKVEVSNEGEAEDAIEGQCWSFEFNTEEISKLHQRYREMVESGISIVIPHIVNLNLHSFLFLPAGVQEVRTIWYDDADWMDLDPLPIQLETQHDDHEGFTRWRLNSESTQAEAGSDLFINIGAELSPWVQKIELRFRSSLDIWRPIRFDNVSNDPIGVYNFNHLRKVARDIASETGGKIVIELDDVDV